MKEEEEEEEEQEKQGEGGERGKVGGEQQRLQTLQCIRVCGATRRMLEDWTGARSACKDDDVKELPPRSSLGAWKVCVAVLTCRSPPFSPRRHFFSTTSWEDNGK